MTYCTTGKRIWPSRRAAKLHAGRVHSHRMRAYLCDAIGPEVPLCDACGGHELPSCEEIWERIAARIAAGATIEVLP